MRRAPGGGLLLLAAVVILAGCGNARTPAPSVFSPSKPKGFRPYVFPGAGFGLVAPKNWNDLYLQAHKPVMLILGSGAAVISVTRYPRTSAPPVGTAGLQATKSSLLGAIRAKDPSFRLLSTRTLRIDGHPAIELGGIERINGRSRRVRSTHAFLPTAEIVVEEYAPPSQFAAVDREVFSRVSASLRLGHRLTA